MHRLFDKQKCLFRDKVLHYYQPKHRLELFKIINEFDNTRQHFLNLLEDSSHIPRKIVQIIIIFIIPHSTNDVFHTDTIIVVIREVDLIN